VVLRFLNIFFILIILSSGSSAKSSCETRLSGLQASYNSAHSVFGWMKQMNDPNGVLDKVTAIGFTFEADGAVLGITGHGGEFRKTRNVVLSTKEYWGILYDYPNAGDFAVWKDDVVEIHYADSRVEAQNNLREGIEARSRKIIKNMIKDATRGDDLNLKWNWSKQEVLYFLFYAFREYVTAPNPSWFLPHSSKVWVEQKLKSDKWSYKLTLENLGPHTHSRIQEVYLDKQGRIGRIKYNFDLMDGGQGLLPVVHDIGGYVVSQEGVPVPTIRRAQIDWKKFSKRIKRLAKDKADKIVGNLFGPFSFAADMVLSPLIGGMTRNISNQVVGDVEKEFFSHSDFGMKGDVHAYRLYFDQNEIP
jgi:hypothetical protein